MKKYKFNLSKKSPRKERKASTATSVLWEIDKLNKENFSVGWEFVNACMTWLRVHNAHRMEGIFRKSGSEVKIKEIQRQTRTKKGDFSFSDDEDPHIIANLLKRYLKEMKEPLFTFEQYPSFIAASAETDEREREKSIKTAISLLPSENFKMIELISNYLNEVSVFSSESLMDVHNLAILFAPNVLRPIVEKPLILISDAGHATSLLEMLIGFPAKFFRSKKLSIQDNVDGWKETMKAKYSTHTIKTFEALRHVKDEQGIDEKLWNDRLENIGKKVKNGDKKTLNAFFENEDELKNSKDSKPHHRKMLTKESRKLSVLRSQKVNIFKDLAVQTSEKESEETHSASSSPKTDHREDEDKSKKQMPSIKEENPSDVTSPTSSYIKDEDVEREMRLIMDNLQVESSPDETDVESNKMEKDEVLNILSQIFYV